MKILDLKKLSNKKIVNQAIKTLESGGLLIFPSETTYGAGVDATNTKAVEKLLTYKSRREGKPLSVAVVNKEMASKYVEINDQAEKLYKNFLPGPITIVSKSKNNLASGVASEFNTLGIRIPDYKLILDILKIYKKPITATSANASGKKRPYKITDIFNNISDKQKNLIDLVLDAGELPHNQPSTVIDTTLSAPLTLRRREIPNKSENLKLESQNEQETKDIAGKLLLKHWEDLKKSRLIICLNGPLGAGKTIFAKGTAKFLKIEEEITSPTYTFINEYDFQRHGVKGKFYHLDLWKIDSQESFDLLAIPKLLESKQASLLVIEWWDQVAGFAKTRGIKPDLIVDFEEDNKNRILNIREGDMLY
ncbi:MAG: L-threonylcarbamoyladenylate synthase [Patescibacteria group bacterium]